MADVDRLVVGPGHGEMVENHPLGVRQLNGVARVAGRGCRADADEPHHDVIEPPPGIRPRKQPPFDGDAGAWSRLAGNGDERVLDGDIPPDHPPDIKHDQSRTFLRAGSRQASGPA